MQSAAAPSDAADWRVDGAAGAFTITLPSRAARWASTAGRLVLVAAEAAGRFAFEPASGCAVYPEPEANVGGDADAAARRHTARCAACVDAHMHMMAFEFLGGRVHCGRPWHRFGAPRALVDCPDHEPGGAGAIGENTLSYGNPLGTHDTRGWPTLKDWPHHASLTHEQSYYKWLERSWRGGLRVFVNLLVDNEVLCTVYPYKKNSCNEMDGVRLQAKRIRELQDYIDAQSGGPGKGWFRIVTNPFQARRVANQGKLAVVLGIEVSELFDCGVQDDKPECTEAQIDAELDEVYKLGVRDMELVNKFDNALGGVAGDTGTTGVVVNAGNRIETGRFWQMGTCADAHNHDRTQPTDPTAPDRDALAGNVLNALLPPGALPLYGPAPHCNARGLSSLGEYLVRRMMQKKMIIDPDHLSVVARQKLLDVVESKAYSGIVSWHSWSTPDAIPRIYRLGGMVTPMAGSSKDFVEEWKATKAQRDPRFYCGIGWGADMNGFAHQGDPRGGANPVTYPFKSFDGKQTIDKQRSGQRVYDINVDGVAHYGLLPDWVEDARHIAGDDIVSDLGRGAESYLQMWERAEGVPPTRCQGPRGRVTRRGLGRVRLGASSGSLLRRAGQPRTRGRAWTWCAGAGRDDRRALPERPRDAGGGHRPRAPRAARLARRELTPGEGAQQAVRPRRAVAQAARRSPPRHRRPPGSRALGRGDDGEVARGPAPPAPAGRAASLARARGG